MTIKINGEDKTIPINLTIDNLLKHLSINPQRVAVEVNMEVVKKKDYNSFQINEGDMIEIVNFVGGG
jgi:sulfur carrier protein